MNGIVVATDTTGYEQFKEFDGNTFGLLVVYKHRDKLNPAKPPLPALNEYGKTQVVEIPDGYAVYFRSHDADQPEANQ